MKECNCEWAQHWQKLAMRLMGVDRELLKAKELLKRASIAMRYDGFCDLPNEMDDFLEEPRK
jgi:hypothetical protein